MRAWGDITWTPNPVRDIHTYKRMIALAIAERELHEDIAPIFKLCIPLIYLQQLAIHFPKYSYAVMGTCFHNREQVYVRWKPLL